MHALVPRRFIVRLGRENIGSAVDATTTLTNTHGESTLECHSSSVFKELGKRLFSLKNPFMNYCTHMSRIILLILITDALNIF